MNSTVRLIFNEKLLKSEICESRVLFMAPNVLKRVEKSNSVATVHALFTGPINTLFRKKKF